MCWMLVVACISCGALAGFRLYQCLAYGSSLILLRKDLKTFLQVDWLANGTLASSLSQL
jgi:hypothetical protein